MATRHNCVLATVLLIECVSATNVALGDTKSIVPFIDGMNITTSDSVATVDVRAQSLGPGFCAVEFTAGGNTVQILAPPLKNSAWNVLATHIGSVSYTITNDVKCDTGITAQIQYYKKS